MLQKSKASPIFGLIESPFFAQSESSFHQGTEVIFPLAAGNTVSPPSSTFELFYQNTKSVHHEICIQSKKKLKVVNYK
jgi:hypothetical protein